MRYFYFLAAFISFLLTGNVYCEPLTFEEVVTSADHYYPVILSSEAELRKSQADSLSAQGGFDPVLKSTYSTTFQGYYQNSYTDLAVEQPTPVWGTKVIAGYRSGLGTFPVYDTKMQTFTGGEFRAGVEVPLLKNGMTDERRTKIRVSETGVSFAKEGLEAQRLEVRKQAAQKYWDWVAAGRKVDVAQALLRIAMDRDVAIRERIKRGDLAEIDQIDNQKSILQRQSGSVSAERYFQKSALDLAIYYRSADGDPVVADADRLPKVYSTESFERIFQSLQKQERTILRHPEIRKVGSQITQLESELALSRNQLLPKLDFYFGIYSDMGTNPGTLYLPPTSYPTEMRASLSFELPLLLRASRGKLASSGALLDKAELTKKLALNKLELQVRDSIQSMYAAQKKLKIAQEEVTVSRKLESSERLRAFHGDSSFLLVNLREQGTRDAIVKEIEAYSEFFKAKAEYEAAVGGPLSESL